jgi:hypothetical protein
MGGLSRLPGLFELKTSGKSCERLISSWVMNGEVFEAQAFAVVLFYQSKSGIRFAFHLAPLPVRVT